MASLVKKTLLELLFHIYCFVPIWFFLSGPKKKIINLVLAGSLRAHTVIFKTQPKDTKQKTHLFQQAQSACVLIEPSLPRVNTLRVYLTCAM